MGKHLPTRGKGFKREEFYSLCSKHYISDETCSNCQTGRWVNVWGNKIENLFYWISPTLWRKWVNSPKRKQKLFNFVKK